MKSFLFAFIVLFTFSGCVSSSLNLQGQNGIVLMQEKETLVAHAKPQEKKVLRFTNLDVMQVKLQDAAKQNLFYEELEANHDYEFKYASVETLKRVFNLSHSHTLHQSSNLLFIQLQGKDGNYVNILAETSSFQKLSFVYGYSNEAFEALAKELGITLNTPEKNICIPSESLTHWSQSDMFLNPLVQPLYRKYGLAF
jgi:hypothetical protein